MAIVENTARRLVLKSGSTTLTLDKDAGKIALQRKLLVWDRKPLETALSDVASVSIDTAVDRASGVEFCSMMVILQGGQAWALAAADKNEAKANAEAVRGFLGLAA
jgi:hypothetical protein